MGDKMVLDYNLIGERIKKLRKENKYTQEKLAEMTDVSPEYISQIERAKKKLSLEMLVKICNAFNKTPCYLLTGTVYESKDYYRNEINDLIKECPPEKVEVIVKVIKPIIEY